MNSKPQIIILSDVPMKVLKAYCQDQRTKGPWSKLETKEHINVLELKTTKFAVSTFTKIFLPAKINHLQMDNIAALSYIVKMEAGTTKFCHT